VDATARFAELLRRPDAEIPLDEAAALIAAHAHPALDVPAVLGRLDELAAGTSASDTAELAAYLFDERGFAGNTVDYGDPRNSYLDEVLERRLGIPISLSVLMMEVGRRRDLPVLGVGMPGHFLVCPAGVADVWVDPFHGGQQLDAAACRARFQELQGPEAEFKSEYLAPISTAALVARMLANLQNTLLHRDPAAVAWVLRLRLRVPATPARERAALASLLGTLGHFTEAADALDALGDEAAGDDAARIGQQAAALRARGN
jgi:regulator of sirC expression with transglutaminase-like and TPR domain